jgi:hypothetical protein
MHSKDFRLSKSSCDALADRHITRFESLLEQAPHPNINEHACSKYLALWQSVKAAKDWDSLGQDARDEVIDAVCEGGYSDCLTPEELASIPEEWDD